MLFSSKEMSHIVESIVYHSDTQKIYGLKSRKLPLLTIFCPYGVIDPKLGSWEVQDQVLRFFWRGVYDRKMSGQCGSYNIV